MKKKFNLSEVAVFCFIALYFGVTYGEPIQAFYIVFFQPYEFLMARIMLLFAFGFIAVLVGYWIKTDLEVRRLKRLKKENDSVLPQIQREKK